MSEKKRIDLREESAFETGSLPGSENIPFSLWENNRAAFYARLDKAYEYVLICETGRLSETVAEDLAEEGFRAESFKGGIAKAFAEMTLLEMQDEDIRERRIRGIEHSIIKTYRKELWTPFVRAIKTYDLIAEGDKIAVCISGGKDSMLMAKLFQELERHGNKNFSLQFLVMDPGYNEVNAQVVRDNLNILGIDAHIFSSGIFDAVANIEDNPCYLCARMRRGTLYAKAKELGCNKIALGHHYDDIIETILMGVLYSGMFQTMMPKLHSANFEGMELIRPMYLIREEDILRWARHNNLHFIQCACRLTERLGYCGGTGMSSKRTETKMLIKELKQNNPYLETNLFKSVENVHLNTLISYKDKEGKVRHFLDGYRDV